MADGTKPLPEPILIFHQLCQVAFIWGHNPEDTNQLMKFWNCILKYHPYLPGANELNFSCTEDTHGDSLGSQVCALWFVVYRFSLLLMCWLLGTMVCYWSVAHTFIHHENRPQDNGLVPFGAMHYINQRCATTKIGSHRIIFSCNCVKIVFQPKLARSSVTNSGSHDDLGKPVSETPNTSYFCFDRVW